MNIFTPHPPGSELVALNCHVVVVASSLSAAPETRGRERGGLRRTCEQTASRMGRVTLAEVEGRGPSRARWEHKIRLAFEYVPTREAARLLHRSEAAKAASRTTGGGNE